MASSSTPTEPSVEISSINATVSSTCTDCTTPFEAQTTATKPEATPNIYVSTIIPAKEPASTKTMTASSTPADLSLSNSLEILHIRSTVQPTSTGFTMVLESPTVSLPSPPPSPATVETEKTPGTTLSTGIPAEEQAITKTIAVASTSADPSLKNKMDTAITSATTQPTSNNFAMSDASPSPTPSPQTTVEPENITSTSLNISNPAEESTSGIIATTSNEAPRTKSSLIDSLECRPRDWGFNVFLDALAKEITDEELKRLKLYFTGENGIGHGTLEKIETTLEFFTTLRKRNILTRDNMIYIQAMLWHLKRQDLHQKCVEYARNLGNATYFYSPSPEPENGYRYAKFHVQSNESVDFDRRKLEYIRTAVAELLLVPPEFVLVCGVQPSSSLIITFMLPEYYATLLIEMVVDYRIPQLLDVGIDTIYYDGKLYDLLGKGNKEDSPGSISGILEGREELLERLKRAEARIEQGENDVLELSRLLDKAKMDLQKVKEENDKNKFATEPNLTANDSLAEQVKFHLRTKHELVGWFFFIYTFICYTLFSNDVYI